MKSVPILHKSANLLKRFSSMAYSVLAPLQSHTLNKDFLILFLKHFGYTFVPVISFQISEVFSVLFMEYSDQCVEIKLAKTEK